MAVVDRKIQTLKQIIHDKMIKTQDRGRSGLWDKALAGIVASINHAPTEKLKGESPDDVAEDTQKVTDSIKKRTFKLLSCKKKRPRICKRTSKTDKQFENKRGGRIQRTHKG